MKNDQKIVLKLFYWTWEWLGLAHTWHNDDVQALFLIFFKGGVHCYSIGLLYRSAGSYLMLQLSFLLQQFGYSNNMEVIGFLLFFFTDELYYSTIGEYGRLFICIRYFYMPCRQLRKHCGPPTYCGSLDRISGAGTL